MKTKLLFLLILFFSISYLYAQSTSSNGWFWQYPKPQGNTLRDIFVFNKDTAIAVGDLSTIIKTTDGGLNWVVQSNVSPAQILYSVQFLDANNGWAAGGNYLVKTNDGGKSWNQVNRDTTFAIFTVYFVDADTGFVFGQDGYLSRTTDGGSTWKTQIMDDYIGGYLDIYNFTAATFTDKNTGWLVGSGYYGNEIYKTTDCGRTWIWNEKIVMPKIYTINDIYFFDNSHGFLVDNEGVLVKTTDGGNTWQYHSLNQDGEELYCRSVFFTDTVTGWIAGGGHINDYLYGDFLLKTTDGGDNWAIADSNEEGENDNIAQLYKIRFSDKNNGWTIGENGMIFRTTDAGSNWISQRDDKHTFNSIYFVDENTGWAVGDSGTILYTTDGGDNWEKQYSENGLSLTSLKVINSKMVVISGWTNSYAVIMKTTDGGENWKQTKIDKTGYLTSVCFSSESIGWAVGYVYSNNGIIKTSDGGITWNTQNNIPGGNTTGQCWKKVQFINEDTGWIANTYGYSFCKTTDGGQNWKLYQIDSSLFNTTFYFVNANAGWAIGDSYGGENIFKTTDGGNSWTSCGSSFSGYSFSIYFMNETTGWIAGYNNTGGNAIIKTTDGGKTWNSQITPTYSLTDIFFINENIGWAVGDGIFKTTNGGGIMSVKDKNGNGTLPKQITLYQNYPNPFNPSTIISWQLTSNSHVTLKIYDILGREIATLVNKDLNIGSHSINWEASKMASGVYFYRLSVQSINGQKNGSFIGIATSETKKMILIR